MKLKRIDGGAMSAIHDIIVFFLNWDSFHAKLNSHYKKWSYKKKKYKKIDQEICLERTYSEKVSVNCRLKAI